MTHAVDRLDPLRRALSAAEASWAGRGEVVLATGLSYRSGEPVLIRVCRRDHRYDLTDEGAAVALAGRPAGFREIALRIVDQQGFNLNRRGVISVPAVAGRDIASLVLRLAEASRRVYLSLLG